jgi:Xaa-Pro dipeptidase
MRSGIVPISDQERLARIEKARKLMEENGINAMFLEGGSSLFYYTGVQWGNSERPFGAVIPARGELAWITPAFEEQRARELIKFSNDVRVWQEDESPYRLIAQILRDRGIATGKVGMDERVRFFIFDGVRQEMPQAEFVIATPVTAGCRMFKSPAEIALMQRANDVTVEAFRAAFKTLKAGMTNAELAQNVSGAFTALGATGGALVIFGKYTAFPHGTVQPQKLAEGKARLKPPPPDLALPEGRPRPGDGRRHHDDGILPYIGDLPGKGAQQEFIAHPRFEYKFLVQFPDLDARVCLRCVKPLVGDRSTG